MTPVTQEFLHKPEIGQYGDCQRAVIASLLDLPIEKVPHFLQDANGDSNQYWQNLQKFLLGRGFVWLTVNAREWAFHGVNGEDTKIYHEIAGPSPRCGGVSHAVVGCNGKIVFDPHPTALGLIGDMKDWGFSFLVHCPA